MFYSDDPVKDFACYDFEQTRRLKNLPECEYCGCKIQDDYYYEINGDTICEICMNLAFRKRLEID